MNTIQEYPTSAALLEAMLLIRAYEEKAAAMQAAGQPPAPAPP